MRVLDLGCGSGVDLASWGVTASDQVTGLGIDAQRLALAKVRFPNRTYQQGPGECLPFEEESFDRVISTVALLHEHSENARGNSPRPPSWRGFVPKPASPKFHDS
jgi:ubiquinone/menaquinone biosynthesis C-methylase UbiE